MKDPVVKHEEKAGTDYKKFKLLPIAQSPLCFDKNEFMKADFSVDKFVADCRHRVSLETLRQDLEIYFKLLKSAMIELINKDYADFVNLSSNLVGMDKAIESLREPLHTTNDDVNGVQTVMDLKVKEVKAALDEQNKLSQRRKLLAHMKGLLDAVEKIEHIQQTEGPNTGQVLERIAGEFNQLQHHASFCKGLPVLTQVRPRIADITSSLQRSLEGELVEGIVRSEAKQVHRCLNSYALIGKISHAENLVRVHIAQPYMLQVMAEQGGDVTISKLKLMFNKILEMIPTSLRLLCDITSGRKNSRGEQFRGIPGYDFVVNSAWPEIVSSLENQLPNLFASDNSDLFHQRYQLCIQFIDSLERHCGSQASITRLRQSESFNNLLTHWSLPVYFQIRFQKIGGMLECVLEKPCASPEDSTSEFRLNASHSVWTCMQMCWKDDVFISGLLHRFWKLTLQLLARYRTWVKSIQTCPTVPESPKPSPRPNDDVADINAPLSLGQLSGLIVDMDLLVEKTNDLYEKEIEPRAANQGMKDTSLLKNALTEQLNRVTESKQSFVDHIISTLTGHSISHLKSAQDVPRLFRKTNRPAPTEASSYVTSVVKPCESFHAQQSTYMPPALLSQWLTLLASDVSERFHTVVSDVLTSVRKMEESLMRLQKMRSIKSSPGNLSALSGGDGAQSSGELSDDDKIRLQLCIDVDSFGQRMTKCGVEMNEITHYQALLALVEEAKSGKST